MTTCPCCGQPVSLGEGDILVSPEIGRVVRGDRSAFLTRQQMTVFATLWRRHPMVSTHDNLLEAIYERGPEPEGGYATLKVAVCKLRQRIACMGIAIDNVHGEGYRLRIMEVADARAA